MEYIPIIIAVLSSSAIVAVIGWIKDRRKDKATEKDIFTSATEKSVTTLLKSIDHLEKELSETRKELDELKRENHLLTKQVNKLMEELWLFKHRKD